MIHDNIDTDRYDEAIEDARAELRVQHVTTRSVGISALLVTAISISSFVFRGEGVFDLLFVLIGSFAAVAASALLVLFVLMCGIGVAGAKHALDRSIRRRDRYILKRMANPDLPEE